MGDSAWPHQPAPMSSGASGTAITRSGASSRSCAGTALRRWPTCERQSLAAAGITYVFLGRELGGKPEASSLRGPSGLPDYDAIAATALYRAGLARLMAQGRAQRTAFMCSEGDPAHCHREKLVAHSLRAEGWRVRHILADGTIQAEVQATLW